MRICVDFDGVLNDYRSGDFAATDILTLAPIPGTRKTFMTYLTPWNVVTILTCRADTSAGIHDVRFWLTTHFGLSDTDLSSVTITNVKPRADIYIDDHAFRFEGTLPSLERIEELSKTWLDKR